MKKPMIKALALSLAFTMALSTPAAVSAEGIADIYSATEESTNTGTGTGTGTGSNSETTSKGDLEYIEENYADVIGLEVSPDVATIVAGEEAITLTATVLVRTDAIEGTDAFRSMSLNEVPDDMVVVFEEQEVLAGNLKHMLVWREEPGADFVDITDNKDGSATVSAPADVKGTTTVSVKLGDVYKACATVNVKKYSKELKLNKPNNTYVKHVINMADPDILERDGNEEIRWNVFQKDKNGTLKKASAATITADGKLTLKSVTKEGQDLIVTAVSDRGGKVAKVEFAVTKGNPIKNMYRVSPSNGKVPEMVITAGDSLSIDLTTADVQIKWDTTVNEKDKPVSNPGTTTDYIAWSSNKTTIAEVSATDKTATTATITAKNPGKAVITAKATSGKNVKFNVTVKAPLTNIEGIKAAKYNIYNGQSVQLTPVKVPHNATDKVKFKINDKKDKEIATVSANGLLKANKKGKDGSVTVTAYGGKDQKNNNKPYEVNVLFQIKKGTITAVNITNPLEDSKKKHTLTLYKNKMYNVEAVFGGEDTSSDMAIWSSNKAKVVEAHDALEVNDKAPISGKGVGLVKAMAGGKANVTVSAVTPAGKTVKDTVAVTVVQPVTQIQLNKTDVTVNPNDKKEQKIALKVSKQLPKGCTKEMMKWEIVATSDDDLAKFGVEYKDKNANQSASAKVVVDSTAVAGDWAKVKVTAASGATAYATITVCNKTNKVEFVDNNGAKLKTVELAIGEEKAFDTDYLVKVIAKDASKAEVISVGQAQADEKNNEQVISYTSNKKFVRIEGNKIYALEPGTATITAKLASGKKATFNIKVVEKIEENN